MLKIGLTGGIACGKSVIRERFASHGVATLDADRVVHELFETDAELRDELAERFGPGVIGASGAVDRKALGAVVFRDDAKRAELESVVHPRVYSATRCFLRTASESDLLAVVDAALMIETGSYEMFDRLVVAVCPRAMQRGRLVARDGISVEQAELRLNAQMPTEDKTAFADYVIDTSGTLNQTHERCDEVLEALRAEAAEALSGRSS